jgi:hypothetical protein
MLMLTWLLRAVQAVEGLREILWAVDGDTSQTGKDHFAATRAGAELVNLVQS